MATGGTVAVAGILAERWSLSVRVRLCRCEHPDLQVREIGGTRVDAAIEESGRALLDAHPKRKSALTMGHPGFAQKVIIGSQKSRVLSKNCATAGEIPRSFTAFRMKALIAQDEGFQKTAFLCKARAPGVVAG